MHFWVFDGDAMICWMWFLTRPICMIGGHLMCICVFYERRCEVLDVVSHSSNINDQLSVSVDAKDCARFLTRAITSLCFH